MRFGFYKKAFDCCLLTRKLFVMANLFLSSGLTRFLEFRNYVAILEAKASPVRFLKNLVQAIVFISSFTFLSTFPPFSGLAFSCKKIKNRVQWFLLLPSRFHGREADFSCQGEHQGWHQFFQPHLDTYEQNERSPPIVDVIFSCSPSKTFIFEETVSTVSSVFFILPFILSTRSSFLALRR